MLKLYKFNIVSYVLVITGQKLSMQQNIFSYTPTRVRNNGGFQYPEDADLLALLNMDGSLDLLNSSLFRF